jgi:hypothetical protein
VQLLFIFVVILFVISVLLVSVADEVEVIRQRSVQYSPVNQFSYADETEAQEARGSAVKAATF